MAVTDDVPDDNVQQQLPLSPQFVSHTFTLPTVEGTCHVSTNKLLSETSCSDGHHTDAAAAAAAAAGASAAVTSSLYASSSAVTCQTDSATTHDHCHVITTSTSSYQSDAAWSGVHLYRGRDALMTSQPVSHVLDMGFDYDLVRTVVHLSIVQSGQKYATASDLVEALLAYNIAISDVDTDTSQFSVQQLPTPLQQQQQQQQVTAAAETTTTSCSQQRHVGCDVTDGAASTSSPLTCRRPGKKKKPRRNKNVSSSNNRTEQSQAAAARGATGGGGGIEPNDTQFLGQFTKLQTSTSDTAGGGNVERLAWEVEMENKRLKAMKRCKICLDEDVAVVFMPCGHLVCCEGCASLLSRCTLCQTAVRDTVKVFMT